MPRPPSLLEIAIPGLVLGAVLGGLGWLGLAEAGWMPAGARDRELLAAGAVLAGLIVSWVAQMAAHGRAVKAFERGHRDRDDFPGLRRDR